jgi:hypothetical protein
MAITTVFVSDWMSVVDYRCDARFGDAPFTEVHNSFCIAYVRKGTFGYRLGRDIRAKGTFTVAN